MHTARIVWERGEQPFTDNRYSRRHDWSFDGGLTVAGSSSPQVVPPPASDPAAIDPEEAFVASLSSCHMLWFLSIAASRGYCVDSYVDRAIGIMGPNEEGRQAITRVTLRPEAVFSGPRTPSRSDIDAMHTQAHDECFIASSVRTRVECEPVHAPPASTEPLSQR